MHEYVCRLVDSPNVLKLLGQCVETAPYLTILELCSLVRQFLLTVHEVELHCLEFEFTRVRSYNGIVF